MKKISIIIPAYNEEDAIEEVIRRVKFISSPNDEILVIDDVHYFFQIGRVSR